MRYKFLLVAVACILFLPSFSFGISINDEVQSTTDDLNVRSNPSTSASVDYQVNDGDPGLVLDGPVSANGYTWWYIQWANHLSEPGWSVEDYLSPEPTPPTVFQDNYNYDWHLRPWSNAAVSINTSTKIGTASLEVGISAAYARLYLQTTVGFNTSGYQTLWLYLYNQNVSGQELYIGLYDMNGNVIHYLPAWNYMNGGTFEQGGWYGLAIPLADLEAINTTIGGVVIEQETTGIFYADKIYFSTDPGSTYWQPPSSTITGVGAACSPTTLEVSQTSTCVSAVQGTGNYSSDVTWSASDGSITSSGAYTAPSSIPYSPYSVTATATSVQDSSKSGSQPLTITQPVQQINQASDAFYSDALGTGWRLVSRPNVSVDLASSDGVYSGNYGIQAQIITSPWGRMQILNQTNYKFNTAGYNYLSLAINIGKPEGEILYLGLFNSSGTVIQYVTLSEYTSSQTLDAYQWQLIDVPLSALGATDTDVYGVEIQSATGATFYVDEIKFKGDCNQ